jgi:predicted transcriptional regulator
MCSPTISLSRKRENTIVMSISYNDGLPNTPSIAPPRARDPLALAGVTVQAVDQIGESAAHEIEEAAAAVELAAGEIGTKLRKLAAAVREHSRIAGEQVADFVNRSTNVIETIRALQERLDAGEPKKGNGSEGADSR